jgi:hypothetical protein
VPPRLARGEHAGAAAARKRSEDTDSGTTKEIPTNPTHHGVDNAMEFVNDPSKIPAGVAGGARRSQYG